MQIISPRWFAAVAFAGAWSVSLHAEYLENTDFKDSIAGWHGDGQPAFLKEDGTEDSMGQPVLKLMLSRSGPHMVYQEFKTHDKPASLHMQVDILASDDYQRSKTLGDYTTELLDYGSNTYLMWNAIGVCNVDFWIRLGSPNSVGWHYKLAAVRAQKWVTVDNAFTTNVETDKWTIYLCVPPGKGTLYIKNPSVAP